MSRNAVWGSLAVLALFLGIAFGIYAPALQGPPISDDYGYLLNPWVVDLDWRRAVELLDPRSEATLVHNNYAPVRPLLHAVEWALFPENSFAYHTVNVVVHALVSWLLAGLLVRLGAAPGAAVLAGLFFLVHPANVEAVAWMSQLWTLVALGLSLGALHVQRDRPGLALLSFTLAMLTKPAAVCVVVPAALREWLWRDALGSDEQRRHLLIFCGWLSVAILLCAVEIAVFRASHSAALPGLHPEGWAQVRTCFAIWGRYLALAMTGSAASTFHEPPAANTWADPWWIGGVLASLLLLARGLYLLRRKRVEAVFWAWAAAGFAPVSQIFPFVYPLADRYLYFILPGLLGGTVLLISSVASRIAQPARARLARGAAAFATAAAILALGAASYERAHVWESVEAVMLDAARHYPLGVSAALLDAQAAATEGDAAGAASGIERCREHGWLHFTYLIEHPAFASVQAEPAFQNVVAAVASDFLADAGGRARMSQTHLRDVARAHRLRGETTSAIEALERALEQGGPLDAMLRQELARARASSRRPASR